MWFTLNVGGSMKLRNVALTSIFILALIVMATEYGVSNYIIKKGFDDLEQQQVASDVRRVKNEFLREVDSLDTFLWDWSSWDDTYQFAQDRNTDFIESNLGISTFQEQNLNLIIVFGKDGHIIYGRAIDGAGKDYALLVHEFMKQIKGVDLPRISSNGGTGGLVLMTNSPLIFASRPVLPSGGDGPAVGSIIMARFLTNKNVRAISERLELPLVAHTVKELPPYDNAPTLLAQLQSGQETVVSIKDEKTIEGFALIRDIKGQPALVLDITEPRRVSLHGRTVALYNVLFTAAVLSIFNILIYILLQRRVISRVQRLNQQVQEVGTSGENHSLVTVDGQDEISQLSQNVNAMLLRIAEDRKALRLAHDDLETKVVERTVELEEANQELLCLDKAKSHFLSSTSHELRTPLTAILGFIKLMERSFRKHFQPHLKGVDEATKQVGTYLENFKIVRLETERLGRLINDLLDLNKIEAGRIEWRDSDVDVRDLIHTATGAIAGQFNDEIDVELVVDLPDELSLIHVDGDRIHQVLLNLLNNAAKFTERGVVKVSAQETGDGFLELSVEDTGSGIPEEEREQIFEIFYQSQTEREYYGTPLGTGLGLAICKEIIEHYGGTIWVESNNGKGSAFKFRLPVK